MASSVDEQILRAAKEIVVKFIETGRVSPTAFPEVFRTIYQAVDETVRGGDEGNGPVETGAQAGGEKGKKG